MQIDISKTAAENLYLLMNAARDPSKTTVFSAATVTLGVPAERTPDANAHNTEILVTTVQDQGYSGTETLTYTRLHVTQGTVSSGPITVAPGDDEAATLTKVAAAMGLIEAAIVGTSYVAPANESTPGSFVIGGKADNLLYTEETTTVTLVLPDTDVPLTESFTSTQLDGFDPAS